MKEYTTPKTTCSAVSLSLSINQVSGRGIYYGGVDETGKYDPAIKQRDVWKDGYWD